MEQTVQNEKTGKLLEVKDLRVSFFTPAGEVKAVSGISYDLDYDEVMGIVGESGSGKSQEAYSIMGLLQSPGKVIGGSITFEGRDVLSFGKNEMAAFRGSEVAMIFQNPMTCLNPVYTVGNQLIEALRAHDKKISKAAAAKRAMEMLELVGINNVQKRMKQYPHEFSGGMRQRVMIAMGSSSSPTTWAWWPRSATRSPSCTPARSWSRARWTTSSTSPATPTPWACCAPCLAWTPRAMSG